MVKLDCEKFLLRFAAAVPTSSLPVSFISCASKHVDNLGAYKHPVGDRPSPPSVFVKYQSTSVEQTAEVETSQSRTQIAKRTGVTSPQRDFV